MVFKGKNTSTFFLPILAALFFCFFILSSCKNNSSPQAEKYLALAASEQAVEKAMETDEDAAFSMALVSDGKILWTLSRGMTDPKNKKPVDHNTLFAIGSLSKVLTAAAIMTLADKNLLDPGAAVSNYLPDFVMASPEYNDITVNMLLDHSSGLAGSHYMGSFTDIPWPTYRSAAYESIKKSRLKHEPGYLHVYCNDGFTLAELVVEAVTGMAFTEYMKKELLDPLGMKRSRFALKTFPEGSYAASVVNGNLLPMENANLYGAGGLYSTVTDLSLFASMIADRGLVNKKNFLSSDAMKMMEENRTKNSFRVVDTDTMAFGLGWDNVNHPATGSLGIRALTKNGATASYNSEFWVLPEEKLGLTILSVNASNSNLSSMAEKIILNALVDKGSLSGLPENMEQAERQASLPHEGYMEAISGHYASNEDLFRVRELSEDSIGIEIRGESEWQIRFEKLRYNKDGWFISDDEGTPAFRFEEKDARRYMVLKDYAGHYFTEIPLAQQLKKGLSTPETWQKRAGSIWLAADEPANSFFFYIKASPMYMVEIPEELPGYVFIRDDETWQPLMPDQAGHRADMSLKIPMAMGRDLSDLEIELKNGEEWFRYAGSLYRPLDSIATLSKGGQDTFRTEEEGITFWIRLTTGPEEGLLSIELADRGRWRLFDQNFEQQDMGNHSKDILLAPGSGTYFLGFYADPGEIITLRLR
ncbi:serine hydrolase domain-containing protein [Desulfobotulus mexicanus]|nr:serine hydrolase domain-containing protein [Desulfobotulus mexicanus]